MSTFISNFSVLISYVIITRLYFMSFIPISCHSYHVIYTKFRRYNIMFHDFNIAFHHTYHTITYRIAIYHIINMSIYHISPTITYFISYHKYIYSSFTCRIIIISNCKHFMVISFPNIS